MLPQELLPKAEAALSKALELDDHLAEALATSAGIALWYDWDWEAARNLFRKAIDRNPGNAWYRAQELDPSSGLAYFHVGRVYFNKRMFSEALSSFQKSFELTIYPGWAESFIAIIHILQGERKKAEEMLGDLLQRKKRTYVSSCCIACIYFYLGDIEKTVEFLEIAYEEQDTLMPFIKVHTEMIDIESDSRFDPLLKKMGL